MTAALSGHTMGSVTVQVGLKVLSEPVVSMGTASKPGTAATLPQLSLLDAPASPTFNGRGSDTFHPKGSSAVPSFVNLTVTVSVAEPPGAISVEERLDVTA